MRRSKAASVERRYVVKARDDCRLEWIADVDDDEPGIPPGNIEAVLVEIDLVTLYNLRSAIRIELVLRRVGLSNMLSLDVKRARENRVLRVGVVDDHDLVRASGLALRRRRTRIHEAVIDFEPVRGSVGPRLVETKELGFLRIRHIVERHPRLDRLTRRGLIRIGTIRVLCADEDFPVGVDSYVVAPRSSIARDEAQGLHLPGILDVGDQDSEES